MSLRMVYIVLAVLLLSACSAAAPANSAVAPESLLTTCRLQAPQAIEQIAAECATLAVPLDYAEPQGASIDLALAVIPAVGRSPQSDPLFLLAGGPGQSAIQSFTPLLRQLTQINQNRDLVLIDQRGTGDSNPLNCALSDAALMPGDVDFAEWVRECAAEQAVDPRFFTTEAAARDLDAVRQALGYEQINLLGVSYGTRLAMTYAQLFPTQTRSLVLDGVVPQQDVLGVAMSGDGQRALDAIFARCAADPDCAAAFPNLPADFAAVLDRLATEPQVVEFADPFTALPTELSLTRDLFALMVQQLSYAPESSALLPLLIHTAAEGDFRPLAAQARMIEAQSGDQIAVGLRFSVICGEDVPFYPAADPNQQSFLYNLMMDSFADPCADWPHIVAESTLRTPLVSDVPTLLLSGQFDPVTPPENAVRAAETLSNSRLIVAPGQGHNIFFRGCLPLLINEFVNTTDPAGLDIACVDRLDATPFFQGFTGP